MIDLRMLLTAGLGLAAFWMIPMVIHASPEMTERARKFVAAHESKIRPLEQAANLAWWNANVTGKDEDFEKKIEAQNRIDEALSDAKVFAVVKDLDQHGKDIDD